MIDRDDLLRYGGHGLTYRIVDRIFQQVPRRFSCPTPGKMGYEDFVYFILSEEDKTTDVSLRYWHRCVDLDDDGIITREDMRYVMAMFHVSLLPRALTSCIVAIVACQASTVPATNGPVCVCQSILPSMNLLIAIGMTVFMENHQFVNGFVHSWAAEPLRKTGVVPPGGRQQHLSS